MKQAGRRLPPGLGTFSARVLLDGARHAGTWSHDEKGGPGFDGAARRSPPACAGRFYGVALGGQRKKTAGRAMDGPAGNEWRGQDSNLRPRGYEPRELPGCSTPRRLDCQSASDMPCNREHPSQARLACRRLTSE
jgi:hypothetical protein